MKQRTIVPTGQLVSPCIVRNGADFMLLTRDGPPSYQKYLTTVRPNETLRAPLPGWLPGPYRFEAIGNRVYFICEPNAHVIEFELSASRTQLTQVGDTSYGDNGSRSDQIIKTASGGLFSVWHQHVPLKESTFSYPMQCGMAYRSPAGSWTRQDFKVVSWGGGITAARTCAVRDPLTGDVNFFFKRDSYWSVERVIAREGGPNGFTLTIQPQFLWKPTDGENANDGELPSLNTAISGGQIYLAYQRANGEVISPTGSLWLRACSIAICRVSDKTFTQFPKRVERISGFGLAFDNGSPCIVFQEATPAGMSTMLQVGTFRNNSWQYAAVDTLPSNPRSSLIFGADDGSVVVYPSASGAIKMLEFDYSPLPTPGPIPVPVPDAELLAALNSELDAVGYGERECAERNLSDLVIMHQDYKQKLRAAIDEL